MTLRGSGLLAVAVMLVSFSPASGVTFVVDLNGAGEFLTIQDGLDAAATGDTVLVYPGIYAGSGNGGLDFGGRDVVLTSLAGQDETIMDLDQRGRGFDFSSGETPAAVVDGFTVAYGYGGYSGGGFRCSGASPTFRNCFFTHCSVWGEMHSGEGGAGYMYDCASIIENCRFTENYAAYSGEALLIAGDSDVTLRDCTFVDNDGSVEAMGAVLVGPTATAYLEGCTFVGNGGRAAGNEGFAVFRECTFVNNGSGPWYSVVDTSSACQFDRCIFAFNAVLCSISCWGSVPSIQHCCFYDGVTPCGCLQINTEINLLQDPLFCEPDSGDYTLCANSPCLPENNSWSVQIGAYGAGCDACNSPVEITSWGAIKAMFR
jgi:hypothetical protein